MSLSVVIMAVFLSLIREKIAMRIFNQAAFEPIGSKTRIKLVKFDNILLPTNQRITQAPRCKCLKFKLAAIVKKNISEDKKYQTNGGQVIIRGWFSFSIVARNQKAVVVVVVAWKNSDGDFVCLISP